MTMTGKRTGTKLAVNHILNVDDFLRFLNDSSYLNMLKQISK